MNRILMVIAAGAALGAASTANAQYSGRYSGGYSNNSDWNYRGRSYASFERDYRHTMEGIRHGLSDGTYSRSRANQYYRELQNIRRAAYHAQRYGNYRSANIQARMARLHERMQRKHERNHDRYDRYGYGNGYGYGYGSYDRYGNYPSTYQPAYRKYDRDDDRHDHDDDD